MEQHEKVALLPIEAGESCGFIPDRLKTFIRIFSLNFPEMKLLGTLWSILSNGYLGIDARYKDFRFSFSYILPCFMTVQSSFIINRQQKQISNMY